MKNYIKKNINVIICFFLITVIFFLCLSIIKKENKANAENTELHEEEIEDTSTETPKIDAIDTAAQNYKNVMPKPPASSEDYLFSQDICGIGNINLCNMHQTSVGLFVVGSTECVYGDIAGVRPGVGVALLETSGTVSSTFYLPAQTAFEYVCSKISPLGIVVITTDSAKKNYYVNIISYNLNNYSTFIISAGIFARIIPTSESFLVLVEYAEETILYDYKNNKLNFNSVGALSFVELFEYGNYYLLFSNKQSGYCITKISKTNYAVTEETTVSTSSLIAVKPIMDNNKQYFLLLENSDAVYAKKVEANLNFATAETRKLGVINIKGINEGSNGLIIIANGNINGLINLGYDLSVSYCENNSGNIISKIYHSCYYKDIYHILAENQEGELCFIKISDGNTSFSYLGIKADKATFAINNNGTIILAHSGRYYEYNSIKILGISL
ncbi:hypothetical protein EOM82_02080 [bacterium]|nr:hypothetical protein [bacterium]